MGKIKYILAGLILVLAVSCREKYRPEVVSAENNNLVVEGVLNAGQGPTTITLTRSSKLDNSNTVITEENAQVVVEGSDNSVRQLSPAGNGRYTSPNLQLVIGNEYRLRIMTNAGKEYLSEYVIARQTPLIDSVGWKRDEEGVELYVNAHDDANDTRYYRWDYEETWEIRTYYYARYIYENQEVRPRILPDEEVFICWKNNISRSILTGSSAQLQSDVISEARLQKIFNGDERLAVRYSILVHQYALDKNALEFYELMRKNTESIGTIFDAQPSEIRGNIVCVSDPAEPVIGYITASTIEEKRIFISTQDLPDWRYSQNCRSEKVRPDSILFYFDGGAYEPYDAEVDPLTGVVTYYFGAFPRCVDCTKRGGSLNKPSFW